MEADVFEPCVTATGRRSRKKRDARLQSATVILKIAALLQCILLLARPSGGQAGATAGDSRVQARRDSSSEGRTAAHRRLLKGHSGESGNVAAPGSLGKPRYALDDVVVVIPGEVSRLALAHATSSWRQGVRAVFILEDLAAVDELNSKADPQHESYAFFPDDGTVPELGPLWHGNYQGDTRAGIAPFLAHRCGRRQRGRSANGGACCMQCMRLARMVYIRQMDACTGVICIQFMHASSARPMQRPLLPTPIEPL